MKEQERDFLRARRRTPHCPRVCASYSEWLKSQGRRSEANTMKDLGKILIERRNKIVEENIRLPGHIAKRLWKYPEVRRYGQDRCQSAGFLAMLRAAELYNGKLSKFSTYAGCAIANAILTEAKADGIVHIPSKHFRKVTPAKYVEQALAAKKVLVFSVMSGLIANGEKDADAFLTAKVDGDDFTRDLRAALVMLSRNERRILKLRFYGKQSIADIAARMGLDKERVRQLQERALVRMRTLLGGE